MGTAAPGGSAPSRRKSTWPPFLLASRLALAAATSCLPCAFTVAYAAACALSDGSAPAPSPSHLQCVTGQLEAETAHEASHLVGFGSGLGIGTGFVFGPGLAWRG